MLNLSTVIYYIKSNFLCWLKLSRINSYSQTLVYTGIIWSPVKTDCWTPPLEFPIQSVWSRASKHAFVINFQVTLMEEPHLDKDCSKMTSFGLLELVYFSLLPNQHILLWLPVNQSFQRLCPILPPCLILLPQNTSLPTQIIPILKAVVLSTLPAHYHYLRKLLKAIDAPPSGSGSTDHGKVSPRDSKEQGELQSTTLPSISFPSRLWTLTEFSLL